MLYDINTASLLLGCLLKQPTLLTLPQYQLCKDDFSPEPFHKIIFIAIANLFKKGALDITEVEIENLIKNYPAQLEIIQDNNYIDFIYTVRELAIIDNYQHYYNSIRKFSLLRELSSLGYNISTFFDEAKDEQKELAKLDKLSIQDILNSIDAINTNLRSKYDVEYVRDEIKVGEGIENLLNEFEEHPSFGALLTSPYLSQLIHGFSRGNLIMRSSKSGGSKTRMAVADICGLCVDKYWDNQAEDFVENLNYQGPGFFIHTELDTRREMQPMFLAAISGVPSNIITTGKYTQEERKRIVEAAKILESSNLILSAMPDFTSASIERKIKECVENYGSVFGCFDYMMLNSAFSQEYKSKTGVQAREDMALRGLATDIKSYCEKYNVGILTMTQTNGIENTLDFPDESCIAGSKAMRNKVDAGFVMLPAKDRRKEMKIVEPFINKRGIGEERKNNIPNRITYLYKARFGEYADEKIKIFHRFDGSTMRNVDLFCCNQYNEFIKIPKPVLTK